MAWYIVTYPIADACRCSMEFEVTVKLLFGKLRYHSKGLGPIDSMVSVLPLSEGACMWYYLQYLDWKTKVHYTD